MTAIASGAYPASGRHPTLATVTHAPGSMPRWTVTVASRGTYGFARTGHCGLPETPWAGRP